MFPDGIRSRELDRDPDSDPRVFASLKPFVEEIEPMKTRTAIHQNCLSILSSRGYLHYPIYQHCQKNVFDAIFAGIIRLSWNRSQFFTFMQWWLDTVSNKDSKSMPSSKNSCRFDQERFCTISLEQQTIPKFALLAEKFDHSSHSNNKYDNNNHKNISDKIDENKSSVCEESDKIAMNYNNCDYFRDLTKVNYILKYMYDINTDGKVAIKRKMANKNWKNDEICIFNKGDEYDVAMGTLVGLSKKKFSRMTFGSQGRGVRHSHEQIIGQRNTFWDDYALFIMFLLFGASYYDDKIIDENDNVNYHGHGRRSDKEKVQLKRKYVFDVLYDCICNDVEIDGINCDYNYNYGKEFCQCLEYLDNLIIQSIETESYAWDVYTIQMNDEFSKQYQHEYWVTDSNKEWKGKLIQIIVTALNLPKNETDAKKRFYRLKLIERN